MTDRIDHKAEAIGLVSEANRLLNLDEPLTAEAAHLATVAQVHATLYLAEQQRVANLIALGNVYDLADGGHVRLATWDPRTGELHPDIAATLGLGVES